MDKLTINIDLNCLYANHFLLAHMVGNEGYPQMLQVFPLLSLMKPDSPQEVPQEFLIFQ